MFCVAQDRGKRIDKASITCDKLRIRNEEDCFDVLVKDGLLSIDLRYAPSASCRTPNNAGIESQRVSNDAVKPFPKADK